ncbi:MAG: nitronate monooxygenase [Prolixibacteraceae bacterium]|jgi:enoyl-[acyl-carrier protein] reductase II|nr:nitronate monooxygenase [Prolixibacteraceae bacterium]
MSRIQEIFNIQYPVVSGGMVWCSGWRLASAVSNAGGLGLIGAGSMHPETLREHIQKAKKATVNPFGVNVPLLYPEPEKIMDVIVSEGVKIVFTSAGSPKKWTSFLHKHGITVAHVVSSAMFAKKSEDAGVDVIVAEGFEAGGHEGREETTTMNLIPAVRKSVSLPLLAAGGIATGEQMLAAIALGVDGVQMGSLFAASEESSAHADFKKRIVDTDEGGTKLMLKQLAPVRLIKNEFYQQVEEAEKRGASVDELKALLGSGRAKKGMFEGDIDEGELEIGQCASLINEVKPVAEIFKQLIEDYNQAIDSLVLKRC